MFWDSIVKTINKIVLVTLILKKNCWVLADSSQNCPLGRWWLYVHLVIVYFKVYLNKQYIDFKFVYLCKSNIFISSIITCNIFNNFNLHSGKKNTLSKKHVFFLVFDKNIETDDGCDFDVRWVSYWFFWLNRECSQFGQKADNRVL